MRDLFGVDFAVADVFPADESGGAGFDTNGETSPAAEKTPLCNLHLTMLHKMGIEEKSFGDSTGVLEGLG